MALAPTEMITYTVANVAKTATVMKVESYSFLTVASNASCTCTCRLIVPGLVGPHESPVVTGGANLRTPWPCCYRGSTVVENEAIGNGWAADVCRAVTT